MFGTRYWSYPRLVAHRASGTLAPENTLRGFALAESLGCRMVEVDAMLTRDGVLILSHDEQLGRAIEGEGCVGDRTYLEMSRLDAGVRFGPDYRGERVCRLDRAIEWSIEHDIAMNIEIKPCTGEDVRTARELAAMVTRYYDGDRAPLPLISSFSLESLRQMQMLAPRFPRGILFERLPDDWEQLARSLDVVAVHPNYREITPDMVLRAHANGWGVMCYTVDDAKTASKLLAMGVDAVCTNRMDLLQPIVVG